MSKATGKGSDDDVAGHHRCKSRAAKISLVLFFFAYVSLGAYVFLLIETPQQPLSHQGAPGQHNSPPTEEIRTAAAFDPPLATEDQLQYESMSRLVLDKLWDITENLNILYKENWTRLASEEIGRFHDSMHHLMKKECTKRNKAPIPSSPVPSPAPAKSPLVKWTYPAAFLYALSVITTLGSCPVIPESVEGKVLTILYAAFGIPLLLCYLVVVGSAVSSCCRAFRHPHPSSSASSSPRSSKADNRLARLDYHQDPPYPYPASSSTIKMNEDEEDEGRECSARFISSYWPVALSLLATVLYILAGSWMFSSVVPLPWTDALLLSFMLFTTTGIPDGQSAVWARNGPLVAISIYIVLGLSLCSVSFHLIYEWLLSRWSLSTSMASQHPSLSHRRSSSHS